jgi:hypothetical protein
MVGFIVFKKLTKKEADENISGINQFFKDNPSRKICRTDLFKVRRGHVEEDVYSHTINGGR